MPLRQDQIPPRSAFVRALPFLLVGLLSAPAGVAAVLWASVGHQTTFDIHLQDHSWNRSEGTTLAVTEDRPFLLPQLFRDFDLYLALELAEATALDLVFRKVEPRADPSGRIDPFHGRFSLLRLSTFGSGPPYRTREQALFGLSDPETPDHSGVLLTKGVPVTVLLEARGRSVRANVGGRWLPWFETADEHGSLALVTHGNKAVLRHLDIKVHFDPLRPLPETVAAVGTGLLLLLIFSLIRARARRQGSMFDETWIGEVRLVTAVVLVILGGGLAHALVFRHTSPQAKVDDIALLCGALCGLPLAALVLATGFRPLLILLGLVAAVVQLEASARIESPRLEPLADPRLDLHFGIASGSAPFDALSLRLRSALAVHSIGDPPPRIMLLGGGAIFEAGADRRALTSVQLMVALHQATGKTVDVTVAATTFGHALQQALLYQRFYQRFAPKVIVLAVGPLESLPTERVAPRDVLAKGAEAGWSTGIRLLDLVLRTRDGDLPPSSPESLRATVLELHAFAAARNIPLVVATTADVDPDLAGVLADWSAETGTPFVPSIVDLDGGAQVAELATVLARVLR